MRNNIPKYLYPPKTTKNHKKRTKNLKVGFFLLHPFNQSMASGVRTIELAKALTKLNVKTVIFTPYEKTQRYDDIEIVNMPSLFSILGVEKEFYNLTRRAYYSRELQKFIVKITRKTLSKPIKLPLKFHEILKNQDLDILQAEQDNAALVLLSAKLNLSIPTILDLHGIWPEELLAANAIQKNSEEWQDIQATQKTIIQSVNHTICLSEAMKQYVLQNYQTNQTDVTVIPPGGRIFCNSFPPRSPPLKITYAGIVSHRKHVDLFIKSIPHIQKQLKNTEFYITKKGDLLKKTQKLAKNLNIQPKYFWHQDLKKTLQFLSTCHIGTLTSTNDTSAKISMPSKLFDYMSVGLPIVANDVGGWTTIIKQNNLGRVTKDTPKAFADAITELLSNPEELKKCGENGIKTIKNTYNWQKSAQSLLNCYKQTLKHNTLSKQ